MYPKGYNAIFIAFQLYSALPNVIRFASLTANKTAQVFLRTLGQQQRTFNFHFLRGGALALLQQVLVVCHYTKPHSTVPL